MESRTPDILLAKQTLYQLSYVPSKHPSILAASLPWDSEKARRSWLFQVGPDGLEPSTFALSERRSNQLSYEPWHTLADQGWRIVGEHPRPGKGEIRFSPQERSRVRATVARWSPSQSSNPTRPLLRRPASGDRPPRALRNGAPAPPGSARADGQDLASPEEGGNPTKSAHRWCEMVVSFVKPEYRLATPNHDSGKEGDPE